MEEKAKLTNQIELLSAGGRTQSFTLYKESELSFGEVVETGDLIASKTLHQEEDHSTQPDEVMNLKKEQMREIEKAINEVVKGDAMTLVRNLRDEGEEDTKDEEG